MLGGMDPRTCSFCGRPLKPDQRGSHCRKKCIWRAWWERALERSAEAQHLPPPPLPEEAEALLPAGPDRLLVANQLALLGKAPADARGYRVGIQVGADQLMRWFPAARFSPVPMFLLEPFEWPVVPRVGVYAVVYMDGHCRPLGGPRFTLRIEQAEPRLHLTDGDRTYKPRPRGESLVQST